MDSKIIIYSTIVFLFASFVFLSVVESRQTNLDNKNVWMLYFVQPKDASLDFTIENHSNNSDFHWEIFVKKIKVQEGDISVQKGEVKTIPVSAKDMSDKKVTISVTGDKNEKEIYKTL